LFFLATLCVHMEFHRDSPPTNGVWSVLEWKGLIVTLKLIIHLKLSCKKLKKHPPIFYLSKNILYCLFFLNWAQLLNEYRPNVLTETETIFIVYIQCNSCTERTHGKMGKLGLLATSATTGRARLLRPVGPLCACPDWLDLQDCAGSRRYSHSPTEAWAAVTVW
jgi:hypothetical protein